MNSTEQFAAIVCEHYEPLFGFALRLTRSEADAWDLTQQTFYVWARKGHQLRDLSKVKTWLFTTLRHAFFAARRKQSRFQHEELNAVSEESAAFCPETAAEADCSQVLVTLARVDENYRAALALFYLEERSYQEIAGILQVPIGTVKSRIARGLAQLRELLTSDGFAAAPGDEIISVPNAGNTPPGTPLPPSLQGALESAGACKRAFAEWDVSPTASREPSASPMNHTIVRGRIWERR